MQNVFAIMADTAAALPNTKILSEFIPLSSTWKVRIQRTGNGSFRANFYQRQSKTLARKKRERELKAGFTMIVQNGQIKAVLKCSGSKERENLIAEVNDTHARGLDVLSALENGMNPAAVDRIARTGQGRFKRRPKGERSLAEQIEARLEAAQVAELID
jgi:hypothetical protein